MCDIRYFTVQCAVQCAIFYGGECEILDISRCIVRYQILYSGECYILQWRVLYLICAISDILQWRVCVGAIFYNGDGECLGWLGSVRGTGGGRTNGYHDDDDDRDNNDHNDDRDDNDHQHDHRALVHLSSLFMFFTDRVL